MRDITYQMNLNQLLNDAINREYRHPRDPSGAYPTSASIVVEGDRHGACPRELFYKAENKEHDLGLSSIDDDTLFVFKRGCMYEDLMLDLIASTGNLIGSNIKFCETGVGENRQVYMSGEIDGLLADDEDPDSAWIWEHKTYTNNYMSEKSLREKGPFHNPKYLLQVMIYLDLFPKRSKYAINGAFLQYTDCAEPGPSKRFIFELNLDSDGNLIYDGTVYPQWNVKKIYDAIVDAEDYIGMGELPPRGYNPDIQEKDFDYYLEKGAIYKTSIKRWNEGGSATVQHSGCSFCDFKDQCMKDMTLMDYKEDIEGQLEEFDEDDF